MGCEDHGPALIIMSNCRIAVLLFLIFRTANSNHDSEGSSTLLSFNFRSLLCDLLVIMFVVGPIPPL